MYLVAGSDLDVMKNGVLAAITNRTVEETLVKHLLAFLGVHLFGL